jgi:acyl-coenzyme A thioesterase PaaI-like protein
MEAGVQAQARMTGGLAGNIGTPESTVSRNAFMPVTKEQINAFMAAEFPQSKCVVEEIGADGATVAYPIGPEDLRPGGTVAGPVLMGVADVALYIAVLGRIGLVPLAVTTSLTINFLRKPSADARIVGVCKLIKVGRSLAVGEVSLYSEGKSEPVAHVVGTYAIPPERD